MDPRRLSAQPVFSALFLAALAAGAAVSEGPAPFGNAVTIAALYLCAMVLQHGIAGFRHLRGREILRAPDEPERAADALVFCGSRLGSEEDGEDRRAIQAVTERRLTLHRGLARGILLAIYVGALVASDQVEYRWTGPVHLLACVTVLSATTGGHFTVALLFNAIAALGTAARGEASPVRAALYVALLLASVALLHLLDTERSLEEDDGSAYFGAKLRPALLAAARAAAGAALVWGAAELVVPESPWREEPEDAGSAARETGERAPGGDVWKGLERRLAEWNRELGERRGSRAGEAPSGKRLQEAIEKFGDLAQRMGADNAPGSGSDEGGGGGSGAEEGPATSAPPTEKTTEELIQAARQLEETIRERGDENLARQLQEFAKGLEAGSAGASGGPGSTRESPESPGSGSGGMAQPTQPPPSPEQISQAANRLLEQAKSLAAHGSPGTAHRAADGSPDGAPSTAHGHTDAGTLTDTATDTDAGTLTDTDPRPQTPDSSSKPLVPPAWIPRLVRALRLLAILLGIYLIYRLIQRLLLRRSPEELEAQRHLALEKERRDELRAALRALSTKKLDAAEEVVRRYHFFLELMDALGLGRETGEPATLYAERLRRFLPHLQPPVRALTLAFCDVFYGKIPPGPQGLAETRRAHEQVCRQFL